MGVGTLAFSHGTEYKCWEVVTDAQALARLQYCKQFRSPCNRKDAIKLPRVQKTQEPYLYRDDEQAMILFLEQV